MSSNEEWILSNNEKLKNISQKLKNLAGTGLQDVDVLDYIFPVGTHIISDNLEFNPIYWYSGSWEKVKDKFLLGSGDIYSVGQTGGSADAVVVSHKHTLSFAYGVDLGSFDAIPPMVSQGGSVVTDQTGFAIGSAGEDGTGKNMPPYAVVNIWKRVA